MAWRIIKNRDNFTFAFTLPSKNCRIFPNEFRISDFKHGTGASLRILIYSLFMILFI